LGALDALSMLAKELLSRGTDLALVDTRDTRTDLDDEHVEALVRVLRNVGFRRHHRVAILHRVRPRPKAVVFVEAALDQGFDFAEFVSYEKAVEWLSRSDEEDPDFDRETYHGPTGERERPPRE
jgi:hypothetical protein